MSGLFIIKNKLVAPNPETLLISPFKEIWKRDKNRAKTRATAELSYIEFMASQRATNPFKQYRIETRGDKLKEILFKKNPDWKPDKKVQEGIDFLLLQQQEGSLTYAYYMSAVKAARRTQDYFSTIDYTERNKSGMPVHKASDVTKSLTLTGEVLKELDSLKDKVESELYESSKKKAGKSVSFFSK